MSIWEFQSKLHPGTGTRCTQDSRTKISGPWAREKVNPARSVNSEVFSFSCTLKAALCCTRGTCWCGDLHSFIFQALQHISGGKLMQLASKKFTCCLMGWRAAKPLIHRVRDRTPVPKGKRFLTQFSIPLKLSASCIQIIRIKCLQGK